jgi:hypothetical protein
MTDTTNIDTVDTGIEADDLAAFSASLFGAEKPDDSASTTEASEGAEDGDTSHEDELDTTDEVDQDTDEGESDDDEPEAKADDDTPKGKKKSRFQERIDDLTGKLREGDRQREDLAAQLQAAIAKLEELSAGSTQKTETPQNTQKTQTGLIEPTAEDTNEDGSPKYPLGEFDPKFLRDLTRYDRAVERAHETQVAEAARAEAAKAAEFNQLQQEWNEKVASARTQYPDYVEKGQDLLDDLRDIPADTAVFLTNSIMSMEYGPDVFYYLAEHPEEARAIATSSPERALTRLGRIEARFEIAAQERSGKETKLRTSKAPEPAPRNKGSNATPPSIDIDTADLADFEKALFKKR